MSLSVPLTLRVGDQHVTRQTQSLSFRKEAVGGVRSISFALARPLTDLTGLDPLSKVYVYDGRSAEIVADGRLADTGRSAGSGEQSWDVVAFGPAQHASDFTQPSVFIERSMSEGWRHVTVIHADATPSVTTKPGETGAGATQGLLLALPSGLSIGLNSRVMYRYEPLYVYTGQTLGGYQFTWDTSHTDASWTIGAVTSTNADYAASESSYSTTWNSASGTANRVVVTNFPAGRNVLELYVEWLGAPTTTADETWGWFESVVVRPQLKEKDGTDLAPVFHANSYIVAHNVVYDLLGRGLLPEYDAARAEVDEGGVYQITHLAYRDGVTPANILDDLMVMNPAYRWYTTPDTTGDGYGFHWQPWPTSVRYEATMEDGGSFPLSAQDLYNEVWVRWVDEGGNQHTYVASMACQLLDENGLTRRGFVDLGAEAGSADNAIVTATTFLEEHNVPKNGGTLNVGRPIRDVITGRMVDPWEIEPGELVRVRGVEAYADSLNADANDGRAVFRIHAVDYTSDGNMATLSLDADPTDVASALASLMTTRQRGRS